MSARPARRVNLSRHVAPASQVIFAPGSGILRGVLHGHGSSNREAASTELPGIATCIDLRGVPQQAQADPVFEVASVKRNASGTALGGRGALPGGRLSLRDRTVRDLLFVSLNLQDYQILGGPDWMNSEGYDIEAKAPGDPPLQQIRGPMLLALLADRFKLQFHREKRELPVYVLAPTKGGFKLTHPTLRGDCAVHYERLKCAEIRRLPHGFGFDAIAIQMDVLTNYLPEFLDSPVIDRTGFTGLFDAHLEFDNELAPGDTTFAGPPAATPPSGNGKGGRGGASPSDLPSLSAALAQQLGIKLERTKGPVEVIIVDHVERPTVN